MSKLALMGRALMSTAPALNPLRRLTLTRRFSADSGGDQTPPPRPPPVEAVQQGQTPPPPSETAAQPQDQAPPPQDASYDPFRQGSGEGLVFGRLTGVGRNTMKTDVIHFLEGSDLSIDDVKVEYNRALTPVAISASSFLFSVSNGSSISSLDESCPYHHLTMHTRMLRFTSQSSYETAVRKVVRKGHLYRLEKLWNPSRWDSISTFNGRTVVLQGLPHTVFPEDIERFLCGFHFDPTSIRMNFGSRGVALVSFQSRLAAMNALTAKNSSFCRNNPITMRILH